MGWIRKQILQCVLRAIIEGDEATRTFVARSVLGAIQEHGISIGGYNLTDVDGTFTITKR